MIVIRKFKDQLLDSIATWGPCDAFGEFLPRAVEDSIQINVLVAKNTKKSKHSNRLGNGATAYYLFSPTDDCQAEIDEAVIGAQSSGYCSAFDQARVRCNKRNIRSRQHQQGCSQTRH